MIERIPKTIVVAAAVLGALALAWFAYSRPGYFANQSYVIGLLLFQLVIAAVWMYRRVFFPLILVGFLWAGVDLPFSSVWTSARWGILGVGALVGVAIVLRDRGSRFGLFHILAVLAVLAALVSAAVSRYANLSFLKVLSLLLLFIYGGTGARLAVAGREDRFFSGLLTGCEVFVAAIAATYFMGMGIMGNPNSLGAVMGVAAGPILLWGALLEQRRFTHYRRLFLYALSMYLTFASHARASIVAAFISCGLLCIALRRYRLLAQGLVILAMLVALGVLLRPEAFSRMISSIESTVVYKGKDPAEGLLASRRSPWQDAVDTIHEHFWFGTGFGTSDNGQDATEEIGKFSSTSTVSVEHGSSYLAITTWVGMAGVLPFFLLLFVLVGKIAKTFAWMRRTGDPAYAAVPLAIVLLAGMVHASLEDWMFAPGYYLCVFFWSMAFVFVDQVPPLRADLGRLLLTRGTAVPTDLVAVAPVR